MNVSGNAVNANVSIKNIKNAIELGVFYVIFGGMYKL